MPSVPKYFLLIPIPFRINQQAALTGLSCAKHCQALHHLTVKTCSIFVTTETLCRLHFCYLTAIGCSRIIPLWHETLIFSWARRVNESLPPWQCRHCRNCDQTLVFPDLLCSHAKQTIHKRKGRPEPPFQNYLVHATSSLRLGFHVSSFVAARLVCFAGLRNGAPA